MANAEYPTGLLGKDYFDKLVTVVQKAVKYRSILVLLNILSLLLIMCLAFHFLLVVLLEASEDLLGMDVLSVLPGAVHLQI